MNAFRKLSAARIVFALAAVVLLAGCASTGSSLASRSQEYRGSDRDYIHAVEQTARRRGVRIVWINPPEEQGRTYVSQVD